MILATADDVKDRLRRPLTADELVDVVTLLEEASVLVEGYLRNHGIVYTVGDVIPRGVVICTSRVAARALTTGDSDSDVVEGTERLTMGPFAAQLADPYSTSTYLSRSDLKWLIGIVPTAVSVPLGSERGGYGCDD